ncbi:MAG TPA: polysaccharide biosynthesis protein, partial [Emticicia sp.]
LKESYPYLLLVLVLLPFTHFSNNFLDLNSSKEELGYFNLADRLIGPVSLVLDIALISLFPNLSSLWAKNKQQFINLINNGFIYYMLISLIFCFLFTLFIEDIFILLFTTEYLPAVRVCQLQIWYLFLSSIDYFMGIILSSANRDKTILRLGVVRAVMATPILYYGSNFGALGLSTAYVLSFTVFQIYLWYIFKKELSVKIKHENPIMLLSISLFVVALFIGPHLLVGYKILLAVVIVSFSAFYINKTYRTVLK